MTSDERNSHSNFQAAFANKNSKKARAAVKLITHDQYHAEDLRDADWQLEVPPAA